MFIIPGINSHRFFIFLKLALLLALAVIINWQAPTGLTADSTCFTPARVVGRDIWDSVTADFNGDGKADLALANRGYNNISILLGDGAGGFGAETQFGPATEAIYPEALTVGDFNHDGKPDIATANSFSHNITVYLNDGNGRFDSATLYPGGVESHSIVTADFDSDGHADLAVPSSFSSAIHILKGDGAGSFTRASDIAIQGASYLALGDFNGDGKADLATANTSHSTVSVLLGDGAGGFGQSKVSNVGVGPRFPTVGDFNRDNVADIAVANQSSLLSLA